MEKISVPFIKLCEGSDKPQEDIVAIEHTYRVFVNGEKTFSFACTPSNLEEMIIGALFSRCYVNQMKHICTINIGCNDIHVTLAAETGETAPVFPGTPALETEMIFQTIQNLFQDSDTLFHQTGCAHRCGLYADGGLLCAFEDISRHNAMDKAIGWALKNQVPMSQCSVFTSGRISGDYMAKIIRAGFPIAVSKAAVTSEAIRLAKENGIALYGFARGCSANRYN